ncbi:glycerate dehydrogenase [Methyloceanibacter marginalis]|uniref:Glycerate dehydrogenase n=1 Tax=Methyloceanibacter marginalis TaxID=1774971 RepID=A0A1E3WB58_9HYPH|nr:D-2-hydroxyacid dehydrogenase [Methyloceanibacter marginalis]ODS03039.1 glycerate dehydrogenase [Methyloceanibacter marginalis]
MEHAIVFLDRESVGANVRKPDFPHSYTEYQSTWTPEDIVDRLKDATIALINKVPMRAEVLKQLPKLKLIAVAATGTTWSTRPTAKKNGITVVNIRNYAFNTVPEHVIALMFALRRNLLAYVQDVKNGRWAEVDQFCFFDHPIRDIAGSTMGVVGYGAIGKEVAKRAKCLGMKILPYDVFPQEGLVDLETVLKESDVITLHCPLTPETQNMIGAKEFKMMKPTSILINTARGGLVDEAALAAALKAGTIAGAGFDVLTKEPPKEGNILLDLDMPNFIVTPHVAWASREAMQILADQLIDNIEAFVADKPQNVVV